MSDFVKRMFSVPIKSRRPPVAPTNLFFIATTPSLRDTSPQGEAFRLPLWGAVGNANCGVAMLFLLSPPLRHFVTPLLKERLFGSHRGELSTQLTEVWLLPEVVCAVPYYLDNQRSPLRISIIIDYLFVGAVIGRPQGLFIFTAYQKGH